MKFADMEKPSPLLRRDENGDLWFHCPGCQKRHCVRVAPPGPVWGYNGDPGAPTFTPSILVTWPGLDKRCHSYVRDGQIQFLDDCSHALKGQTVPIPPWDDA
jgi:hypothetical protein